MTNVDLGGEREFGNAKSAFHSKPNRATARQYLLAWADQTAERSASTTSAALLRKLARDSSHGNGIVIDVNTERALRRCEIQACDQDAAVIERVADAGCADWS